MGFRRGLFRCEGKLSMDTWEEMAEEKKRASKSANEQRAKEDAERLEAEKNARGCVGFSESCAFWSNQY